MTLKKIKIYENVVMKPTMYIKKTKLKQKTGIWYTASIELQHPDGLISLSEHLEYNPWSHAYQPHLIFWIYLSEL